MSVIMGPTFYGMGRNRMNRDHKDLEGYSFTVDVKADFFEWLKLGYGSIDKFMHLSPKDKEEIFLRWKWKFSNSTINRELEMSEQATLQMVRGVEFKNEGMRSYIDNKAIFDTQCRSVKQSIGI